jgi:hypothetical protein
MFVRNSGVAANGMNRVYFLGCRKGGVYEQTLFAATMTGDIFRQRAAVRAETMYTGTQHNRGGI